MTCNTIKSIDDAAECQFREKILTIDLLPDEAPEFDAAPFEEAGWTVICGPCSGYRGMINNIRRGLPLVTADSLFYCEDHVHINRVPDETTLNSVRTFGIEWVCYNTHIEQLNLLNVPGFIEKPDVGGLKTTFVNTCDNYTTFGSNTFLVKGKALLDEYYLNFPAALTTPRIFKALLDYGCKHYQDIGIEIGFTKAWFDAGFNDKYKVSIYVDSSILNNLGTITFSNIHQYAQMKFRNNDPAMLHASINAHQLMPFDKKKRNSFF
jgi:hypothetical protein